MAGKAGQGGEGGCGGVVRMDGRKDLGRGKGLDCFSILASISDFGCICIIFFLSLLLCLDEKSESVGTVLQRTVDILGDRGRDID
jgi:hypothetical protein